MQTGEGTNKKSPFGKILMLLSLGPLGFLLYTIFNLGSLGITVFHPRVLVEFFIFACFFVAGLVLEIRKR
jgi:hypothetical protein